MVNGLTILLAIIETQIKIDVVDVALFWASPSENIFKSEPYCFGWPQSKIEGDSLNLIHIDKQVEEKKAFPDENWAFSHEKTFCEVISACHDTSSNTAAYPWFREQFNNMSE